MNATNVHPVYAAALARRATLPDDRILWLEAPEVAALCRTALRDAFPGTKFSVKSHRYSMGSSVLVKAHTVRRHSRHKLLGEERAK